MKKHKHNKIKKVTKRALKDVANAQGGIGWLANKTTFPSMAEYTSTNSITQAFCSNYAMHAEAFHKGHVSKDNAHADNRASQLLLFLRLSYNELSGN